MSTAPKHQSRRAAFTLVELLVVIGIIVVLIGILLPVINNVKKQAYVADTKNQIGRISALMQAYYNDFNAYPGPIPNTQLRGTQMAPNANNVTTGTDDTSGTPVPLVPAWTPMTAEKITMAENVVLGLLGGLKPTAGATPAMPAFTYSKALLGQGPRFLGNSPKKMPAYGDVAQLSAGHFTDSYADADDSPIPEFVDNFPNTMPILIMRARPGIVTPLGQPVVSANPSTTAQYDQTQVTPYTDDTVAMGKYIGEGKYQTGAWVTITFPEHGFNRMPVATTTTHAGSTGYTYPLNINAALRHKTIGMHQPGGPMPTEAAIPKQKDGYILISAGIDRVYGTQDDITNFGDY